MDFSSLIMNPRALRMEIVKSIFVDSLERQLLMSKKSSKYKPILAPVL